MPIPRVPGGVTGPTPRFAAKGDEQAGTSTVLSVNPAQQHQHDSAAKVWVAFDGTNATIHSSYNVSAVVRNSAGDYTVTYSNALATANHCLMAYGRDTAAPAFGRSSSGKTALQFATGSTVRFGVAGASNEDEGEMFLMVLVRLSLFGHRCASFVVTASLVV